jgi:hypothetical protein
MSAENRPFPDPRDIAEPDALPADASWRDASWRGASWRGAACQGCGQRPEDLTPLDAVAVSHFLRRRCASLLRSPAHSLAHHRDEPGSWSAMVPAVQVSELLHVADSRLRDLLGEENLHLVPAALEAPDPGAAAEGLTPAAVLASITESVGRLTATIVGATTEDWYRLRPNRGATAGEVVWLAVHAATHHLEDAELLLDAALAPGGGAWGAAPHRGAAPPSKPAGG